MATRRQFLQGSLAAAGLAMATDTLADSRILAAMQDPAKDCLKLEAALFEPAHAYSAAFGAAARRMGLPAFAIDHDITPVWLHVVQLWRNMPVAIGGLTSQTPLLLLEQSARDYGLRVRFRGEHHPAGQNMVSHLLEGPGDILHAFEAGTIHGADYGTCMAHALIHCPMATSHQQTARLQITTTANDRTELAPLYSWIMVPREQGTTT
ncbi:hypothetical protein ABO04_00400 [Nitrosomonas sp. HPC101]|nr:hypothetical protein [Nitrosomonas sp. HPC101]